MSDILAQGDPRWAKARLGEPRSGSTIGASGCLLTAWAQALRVLKVDEAATPLTVLAATLERPKGAPRIWFADQPVQVELGRFFGIAADELVRSPPELHGLMRKLVLSTLAAGGVVVLHVDRHGDGRGDHFVLGVAVDGDDVVYHDPAGGRVGRLVASTLADERYTVVSARALTLPR